MGEGLLPHLLTYFLRRWKTLHIFETSKPTDTQGKAAQKISRRGKAGPQKCVSKFRSFTGLFTDGGSK